MIVRHASDRIDSAQLYHAASFISGEMSMFREDITVLDCTVRDGGLINRHCFDYRFVREVYRGIAASGVDYMEIGYRNSPKKFSVDEYGPWKFSSDDDIRKVVDGIESSTKISVMVDIGRMDMDDFRPASESPVSMVRTASYVKDIDKAVVMANNFRDLGYETSINIMAISRDSFGGELDEGLAMIEEESDVGVVYIVDSFGNLFQRTVVELIERFRSVLKTKQIGFHGHNHMQLAFGNTIEAVLSGASFIDGTVYGIGRAAGNCPLELILGFFKNRRYDIRPVLDLIAQEFLPLREEIEWGYIIPYAISGLLNEHPRAAMALRNSPDRDDYRRFYDKMSSGYMD